MTMDTPPPQDPAEAERILAQGRRKFHAPDPLLLHTEHARALRAAFMEGISYGSQGMLDDAEPLKRHAWDRSDAKRHLLGNPRAHNIIGMRAMCDDPRAEVMSIWTIAAIHHDHVWITAHERTRNRVDLLVHIGTIKMITGERIA